MFNKVLKLGYRYTHLHKINTVCVSLLLITLIILWYGYVNFFSNVYRDKTHHSHINDFKLLNISNGHSPYKINPSNNSVHDRIVAMRKILDDLNNRLNNTNNVGNRMQNNNDAYMNFARNKYKFDMNNNRWARFPSKHHHRNISNDEMVKFLSGLERIIHIDLKGAPPKIDYFKNFIPMLKSFGATGLLIEYEDMFPFKGKLEVVRHGNAYTENDIKLILKLAAENGLKVMPLIQTYGHLEWLLKHEKFAHLREHPEYPQVITPCIAESYTVIFDMLDQVLALHPDVPYVHIGCDEVYYKLANEKCQTPELLFDGDFTLAFMTHIVRIAEYVRKILPKAKIIIWDDMAHDLSDYIINKFKPLVEKHEIEPMIWAYVEDVIDWYQPDFFYKISRMFPTVWSASAYKGASGELTTVTSVQHHYRNQISWNKQMFYQTEANSTRFRGVAITGWSRYDHFLQLCDLLPQAIPSLVFTLKAAQVDEIDDGIRSQVTSQLGCRYIPWNLDEVNEGRVMCNFPGHEIYEAILPIKSLLENYEENMAYAKKYVSPISIKYNYVHKARAKESIDRLEFTYADMNKFRKNFIKACQNYYWNDTINEWLEVYFLPQFNTLYEYMVDIRKIMKENKWLPRPLPIKAKNYPDFV